MIYSQMNVKSKDVRKYIYTIYVICKHFSGLKKKTRKCIFPFHSSVNLSVYSHNKLDQLMITPKQQKPASQKPFSFRPGSLL